MEKLFDSSIRSIIGELETMIYDDQIIDELTKDTVLQLGYLTFENCILILKSFDTDTIEKHSTWVQKIATQIFNIIGYIKEQNIRNLRKEITKTIKLLLRFSKSEFDGKIPGFYDELYPFLLHEWRLLKQSE